MEETIQFCIGAFAGMAVTLFSVRFADRRHR